MDILKTNDFIVKKNARKLGGARQQQALFYCEFYGDPGVCERRVYCPLKTLVITGYVNFEANILCRLYYIPAGSLFSSPPGIPACQMKSNR